MKLKLPQTTKSAVGVVILAIATSTCIRAITEVTSYKGFYISFSKNNGIGGDVEKMFVPENDVRASTDPTATGTQDEDYKSGLAGIEEAVRQAKNDGKRLRPHGTKWTVNGLPYTNEYMIDTRRLTYTKVGIDARRDVTEDYRDSRECLTFVQAGVRMRYLYSALFEEGLTLPTSTVTDGVSFVGAVMTGAHNSALHVGGVQDFVKGIHLVLADRTVFLQKKSDQVVTENYANSLGAELVSDDDFFLSALVSYGIFGVVHGLLIKPEELFYLETQVRAFPWSEAKDALFKLDVDALGFSSPNRGNGELPWHFDVYCNPNSLENDFSCFTRTMEKTDIGEIDLQLIKASSATYEPQYRAKDVTTMMGGVTSQTLLELSRLFGFGDLATNLKRSVYSISSFAVKIGLLSFGGLTDTTGYPGELYGDVLEPTDFAPLPIASVAMELCMPVEDLEKVATIALDILYDHPAPVQLVIRYAPGSEAYMAPNHYDGMNAYFEFGGMEMLDTYLFYQKLIQALEVRRDEISFNYHLSKVNPENNGFMRASFGERYDMFKEQRLKHLSDEERRLFSSDYTDLLGLSTD